MELLLTGCLLVAAVTALYYYLTWDFGYWDKQGVKCDRPWPILGTLTPYWKKSVTQQDAEGYKKYGSIYGYFEGSQPALSVAEPELLRQILIKDFAAFPNHRDMRTGNEKDILNKFLTVLEGDEWREVRHAFSPTFSSKKLKPLVQVSDDTAQLFKDIITKHIDSKKPFCLKQLFGQFSLDTVSLYSMGLKVNSLKDQESKLFRTISTVFSSIPEKAFFLTVIFPKIAKFGSIISPANLRYMDEIIKRIMANRQKTQEIRADTLDVLLSKKDRNSNIKETLSCIFRFVNILFSVISSDAISAQALLFLTGYDVVGTMLGIICYELAINPDIQEKFIAEIDEVISRNKGYPRYEDIKSMEYLDMIVQEMLRKYPPVSRADRRCGEEGYNLNGIKLHKGLLVTIPINAIHHDEKYYPDPDKFDPERFNRENKSKLLPFTYLPFGLGPRSCVARRLGLMSIKLPLIHFFSNFRVKPLPTTEIPLKVKTLAFGNIQLPSMYLDVEKRIDQPVWE